MARSNEDRRIFRADNGAEWQIERLTAGWVAHCLTHKRVMYADTREEALELGKSRSMCGDCRYDVVTSTMHELSATESPGEGSWTVDLGSLYFDIEGHLVVNGRVLDGIGAEQWVEARAIVDGQIEEFARYMQA